MWGFKNKLPVVPTKKKIDKVKQPLKALTKEQSVKIPVNGFTCVDSLPEFLKKKLENNG